MSVRLELRTYAGTIYYSPTYYSSGASPFETKQIIDSDGIVVNAGYPIDYVFAAHARWVIHPFTYFIAQELFFAIPD